MKVLITGGAGFIGSHLCELYLSQGHQVYCIDNFSTGRKENIEHLGGESNGFYLLMQDVTNMHEYNVSFHEIAPDIVIHLAAAVGVQYIMKKPVQSIRINIQGTESVLHCALSRKEKTKIFIASTSEVYGKQEKMPLSEEMESIMGPPCFKRWNYACSKSLDEYLALAYHEQYNIPVVIGRFFNTIGPRQVGRYGMVVPRFIEAALKDEPLIVYGNGKQTRCFTYVKDVCNAVIKLMESKDTIGQIFNIGSDEEISINELALKIINRTGSKSIILHKSYKDAYGDGYDDTRRRVADTSKIETLMGKVSTTKLNDVIDELVEIKMKEIL